jgi:hypothetical protein
MPEWVAAQPTRLRKSGRTEDRQLGASLVRPVVVNLCWKRLPGGGNRTHTALRLRDFKFECHDRMPSGGIGSWPFQGSFFRSCRAVRGTVARPNRRELRRGGESIISPVQPAPRRLPHASDLLDSIMVAHRTRVIPGCRQMGRHIPPVPPPVVVHRTQNVKGRQRAVDKTCQRVQLRRFANFRSHH